MSMSNTILNLKKWSSPVEQPGRLEWASAAIVFVAAILLYSQGKDLLHIVYYSKMFINTLIHGQALDFYTLSETPSHTWATYSPFVYLIFGISYLPFQLIEAIFGITFSIPMQLLTGKVVIACWLGACTILLGRLIRLLGLGIQHTRWGVYLFLTSPIAVFCSVLFGQIDIISIAFTLAALVFFSRKQYWAFVAFMAPAICFKWFGLFLVIPLILLVEKRIGHAIGYIACSISGVLVTWLIYGHNQGYINSQAAAEGAYGFKARLFVGNFFGQMISLSMLCFILVCVACYIIRYDHSNLGIYLSTIPLIIYGSLLLFYYPHPQWFILLVPYLILMALQARSIRIPLLVDSLLSIGLLLFNDTNHPRDSDNYAINNGVISWLSGRRYEGPPLLNAFKHIWYDNPSAVSITILTAGLLVMIALAISALRHPSDSKRPDDRIEVERGLVYLRQSILVIVYMIPAIILFILR